jgi:hypothetical protein
MKTLFETSIKVNKEIRSFVLEVWEEILSQDAEGILCPPRFLPCHCAFGFRVGFYLRGSEKPKPKKEGYPAPKVDLLWEISRSRSFVELSLEERFNEGLCLTINNCIYTGGNQSHTSNVASALRSSGTRFYRDATYEPYVENTRNFFKFSNNFNGTNVAGEILKAGQALNKLLCLSDHTRRAWWECLDEDDSN